MNLIKSMMFHCVNCEARRKILVKHVDAHYIVGVCETCKSKVTINRAKAKLA